MHGAACSSDTAKGTAPDAGSSPVADAGNASPDPKADSGAAFASSGCNGASVYGAGTSTGQIQPPGAVRTFRVHVPPGYDGTSPFPVVLMFHGGGGSGRQFEEASAEMDPIADREHFITVYPDGTGVLRSWNGGGCCAAAVQDQIDDVGFVRALIDHIGASLCIDERRVFASGMSNGAILSQRLGCELADRLAAIAPVAGTDMTSTCEPARPLPILEVHGTADGHVPFDGGEGCGPTSVPFTSVPDTIERWRTRNGCGESHSVTFQEGDGTCETYAGCSAGADVTLCSIAGGGHNWPGGKPPADLAECPGNGFQSSTFMASEVAWRFFAGHPMPLP
jgi:polyhydroxybutyrate depolymerase